MKLSQIKLKIGLSWKEKKLSKILRFIQIYLKIKQIKIKLKMNIIKNKSIKIFSIKLNEILNIINTFIIVSMQCNNKLLLISYYK